MSLEVFGDEGSGADPDVLYERGWESDPDGNRWWRRGEEKDVYTFEQATLIEEERSADEPDGPVVDLYPDEYADVDFDR
jgi:hypothetical protein